MSISASLRRTAAGHSKLAVAYLAALCALAPVVPAQAEDVVHVAVGESGRSRARLTGEVLDYTGQTLLMRLPGGIERAFPAERVILIETKRTAEQLSADRLYEQRQLTAAIEQYRRALDQEPRRFVRREIMARLVRCYHESGDVAAAVQHFLLLVQSDPHTPHFECIPLAWLPGETAPQVSDLAQKWMARADDPVAGLLGASHLLATTHRQAAEERLRTLTFHQDGRISWLARGQLWRTAFATANELQVQNWAADIEKIPEPLRGGPYFMLGEALSAQHKATQAALAYLRVPILYPQDRLLAGRALLEAGRELERIGQKSEAASLYQEVVECYPQSLLSSEAQQRLQSVQGAGGKASP